MNKFWLIINALLIFFPIGLFWWWSESQPVVEEAAKERQKRMQEDLPYPIKSGGGELGRLLRERDEYPVQKKPVEDY